MVTKTWWSLHHKMPLQRFGRVAVQTGLARARAVDVPKAMV